MQIKSLFDRLDVLGEDVKQMYITNLTECNPPQMADLGYVDWMLYDTKEPRGFGGGFPFTNTDEGSSFWYEQQAKFNLLNDDEDDN